MGKKKGAGSGPFDVLRALKDEMARAEEARKAAKGAKGAKSAPGGTSARAPGPVPAPAAKGGHGAAREDDALALHRMYAGVVPLDRKHERVSRQALDRAAAGAGRDAAARAVARAAAEADAVREHLRALIEGPARFEVSDDGVRVEGRRIDLAPDALRRLRRGLLPVDGRLDLHGMDAGEARAALEKFLAQMRARGERCVLVIHGKGLHSDGGTPVLRGEIGAWLSQGAASQHVAAFATARGEDGGEGAVYVLLRR
jgi:DNA-nicking Smr family endonuclease